jgi:hypothetical protein
MQRMSFGAPHSFLIDQIMLEILEAKVKFCTLEFLPGDVRDPEKSTKKPPVSVTCSRKGERHLGRW